MDSIRCTRCKKDVEPRVTAAVETLPVRGEDVSVDAMVASCPDCGEELYCEELDSTTLSSAFDEYRRRHSLLTGSEIEQIRESYGLSQKSLSLLLGWGEVTLHRYESGSLQDSAHDTALRLCSRPENILLLLDTNGHLIPTQQRQALAARVAHMLTDDLVPEAVGVAAIQRKSESNEFTGYTPYDPAKLREMILYFCQKPDMLKTKLNKLLFYSDFSFFQKFTVSISGAPYLHMQFGPVPEHYDLIESSLVGEGALEEVEVVIGGYYGMNYRSLRIPEVSVFNNDELQTLAFVSDELSAWTASALSQKSHHEAAWISTSQFERIPYRLAETLSLRLP